MWGVHGIRPAQLSAKLMQTSVSVDPHQFDLRDLRELLQMVHGQGLTKARMVRTTGIDPGSRSNLEAGLWQPDGAGDRQLRQSLFWRDHVNLIDDHAEA